MITAGSPRLIPALIPATILARLTIWMWGAYAIWQGQGIIWDGPERFSGPSFAVLREAPYPTLVWGWSLTVSGALMLLGSILQSLRKDMRAGFILKGVGCVGVAVWSVVLAVGALQARALPGTPGTGGRTYIAVAIAVLILVLVDERKRAHRDGG